MRAPPQVLIPSLILAFAAGCIQPPIGLYSISAAENIEFVRRAGRPLMMDIYRPTAAPVPHPGVILFHGGGWMLGDRSEMTPLARYLASIGYTAATVQYRLTDEDGQYPAPVCDALAAVKFLRKNAAAYDIDPQRMAAIGYSAGAELALLVGLTADPSIFGDDSHPGVSTNLQAVVDISGPTDLERIYDGGPIVQYLSMRYLEGTPEKFPEKWKQASPVTHVRPGAPPVLIMHGDQDSVVAFEQGVILADALRRAGVEHQLVRIPKGRHDWNAPFGGSQSLRALPLLTRFLAKHLEAPAAPPPATDGTY